MDSNNWRPNQGTEPTMDTSDWRAQLHPDSRQRVVTKIMDTLKKHLPVSSPDKLVELQKVAQRFEEKIFGAATNQADYLRKISLKMISMESKSSQNTMANNMSSDQVGPSNNPPDRGHDLQPQVHIPGQQHPITLPNQQPQRQQLLSQNIQNNTASQPNLPPVSSLAQTSSQNIGQSSNMQNIPAQNSVGSTISQISHVQDMFPGSQRQMPGRQQVVPQQSQQQPHNSQQYLYQQQLIKHKLQLQSQIQQQRQQNLLQPSQLQPPMMQTSPLSSLQQNQQPNNVQQSSPSMLQQHSQVIRQQQQQNSIINQQQTSMSATNPMLSAQQQQQSQQLMGLQSNATSMQHAQMLGPQNNVGDIEQPQRLLSQKHNLTNMQQRQHQLLNQQSNLANIHQQQLGNSVPGLGQQQLVGPESGNSGMQTGQHSAHMLQQTKVPMQQQAQQNASLLPSLAQQSQPQGAQQQLMPQVHAQSTQLQQQLGLQQQRDMQQRLQASGLIQQQHDLDQQKQIYQSQRALPETSAGSLDSAKQTAQPSGADEQEEVYQKVKAMKESYLLDLSELYQRISPKLRQYESLPQQVKSDQFDKLKMFGLLIERLISFLKLPKNNLPLGLKEKLGSYEKQIINVLSSGLARRGMPSVQTGQLPPSHASTLQQQSQVSQVQSHENKVNSQLQPSNIPGSVSTMQQNNNASLQHNSMSGVSAGQQNMNSMQLGANLDSGLGDSMNSLQQVPMSSLQQNSVSTSQQTNVSPMSSQGGVNVVQQNLTTLQCGSSMLQSQKLKHHQEQQMLQSQQFKQQYQQRLLMQRQQMLQQQQQQLHQPAKQQLSAMKTHQQQLQHMNDINDMKMRQGMGVKQGIFQQHLTSGQHSAYPHQQSKQGGTFHVSSPQLLQAASPQILQQSSPQVEQQNHLSSLAKVATPLQHSNSPFVGPTPSPPLVPSPMPGDSEKPISATIGHQMGAVAPPVQSLAIGTPGISASPLLAEFSGPDGANSIALADTSGKSEEPIEHLIRVLKSMSSHTLSAAVSEIGSVVSMNDRIAGSGPANGSRAAVGEDIVSVTNCRLQARNTTTEDGTNRIRRMKRHARAIPSKVASYAGGMDDRISQSTASETSDMDSTATSCLKKPKIEVNHALLEEIREINNRLVDAAIDIIDEYTDPAAAAAASAERAKGTIVKCSYKAVALSPSLKAQYAQMSPIQPLRLLVPENYPNCSPIFLDKFPLECCKENEDLSVKATYKFSISLRCLKQPMSLKEIAKTWDKCARDAVSDYAQKRGAGTFSSKYGGWENVVGFD